MQTPPFALTKIQPPLARGNLIARAALEQRLGEALATRDLTLLSAPAGFGKTAALTRQLETLDDAVALAWIAADEDDDLHRFLVCLFAALEPFDLPWRAAPDALIAAAVGNGGDRRGVAAGLLNALAASEVGRGLVVIDDAHRIADPAVFEFLDALLERLPEHWGLVISSRVDPPLALARLRARDQLAELRQSDFEFARDEVAALLNAAGSDLDPTRLHQRTGGWAAGLRLALNTAANGRGEGSAWTMDRHMFDYLAAEVVDQLPTDLREFLVHCSVLPELTAARCAAVTGANSAAQLLAEVERRGLFVSVLDGSDRTLTLHDLFRECLDERLRREHADALPELLARAADTESDPIRRLSFLLRAGNWERAERVFEAVAEELLAAGAIEPVLRLIEQFPPALREGSPVLALVRGQVAWARWDWRPAGEEMRRARIGFTESGDERGRMRAEVFEAIALTGNGWTADSKRRLNGLELEKLPLETRALALAARTWHALDSGQFRAVARCYANLLDVLEQTDRLEVWYQCFQRPLYVWLPGMRGPLIRFVDGVMRRNGDTPSQMRAMAYVIAAWLALFGGDPDQALERITQAQDDARWLGSPTRLGVFVNVALAAVQAARGESAPALAALAALLRYFDSAPPSGPAEQPTSMLAHYLFYAVRLADALGEGGALRAFAARIPPPDRIKNFPMLRAPLATVPARLAALDGRYPEACAAWARALRSPAALEVIGLAQEARLRYAHALLLADRPDAAARQLKTVVRAVGRSGELGGVALAGPVVLRQLAAAPFAGELDWTERALIAEWAQRLGRGEGAAPSAVDGPLSAREMQVLERIAAGDSNKLIARAFDLSPHTVKRHVANILDKLAVSSRGEAARWYRARQLAARNTQLIAANSILSATG